jgi:hypothetical protein
MTRTQLAAVAALFIGVSAVAAPAADRGSARASAPGAGQYNPFTLRRDAPSVETKRDNGSRYDAEKAKKLKHEVKPPNKCKPRSPHKPHDDDDDDDDHDDDDHGHGHHDDDHGHGGGKDQGKH